MTRRRYRRDALADRVADSFLSEDLVRALSEIPERRRRFVHEMLKEMDDDEPGLIDEILAQVRLNPERAGLLLPYLGDRAPLEPGRCPVCRCPLPQPEPGKPGRPALYCSEEHRRKAYLTRRKKQRHTTDDRGRR